MKFNKKVISFIALLMTAINISCGRTDMWSAAEQVGVEIPRFTVTYDANGSTIGTVPVDAENYKSGEIFSVPGNTGNLEITGYTFTCWNTLADGSGKDYIAGSTFLIESDIVVLYAKWTIIPAYTLTYDSNGADNGTIPVDPKKYENGSSATVLSDDGLLTLRGFKFSCWNTLADGSGTDYAPGSTIQISGSGITLFVKWIAIAWSVTYKVNNGTSAAIPIDNKIYSAGEIVTVMPKTDTMINSVSFIGWNTQSDGYGTNYTAGQIFTMGTANVILYAIWHTSLYALRDKGPAGGWIFYDKGSYSYGWQYLEAAPEDQGSNVPWINAGVLPNPQATANGQTGIGIGTGRTNTTAIIAQINHISSAAKLCRDYFTGGYYDWFLPSQDELNEVYLNLRVSNAGGFTSYYYWSSSELSSTGAYRQFFGSGTQGYSGKQNYVQQMVRAIRAF